VSYDLYDKESLTWDDDRKVAAFITPSDSALRNYSSYIRQTCKDYTVSGFSPELQTAMQIYYALAELGVLYQRDPTSPFEAAQENPMIVDAISLPRNTLKRATGDCDDLTVLFCSLLESVGIETAFITVPGHIYAAFKTSTPSKSYKLLHPEKNMTFNIDGELWVPVEITLMGEADFLTAWRTGVEEFTAHDDNPEVLALNRTRKAQETYRPVVLTEKDLGLQYGDRTKIIKDFKGDLDKSIAMIIDDYETQAKNQGSKGSYNRLGITCAKLGEYNKAEQAFNSALTMDRNYLPPKINLGNVYFMKGEYQNALRLLHGAEKSIVDAGKTKGSSYSSVLLSISKCYYELENFDKADEYMTTLTEVDPAAAQQNSYLASGESGQRASDRSTRRGLIFADE
jgi:tetratricopeptide (TPR) repeat protein